MADCNTIVYNGQEYNREDFIKSVQNGEINLPSVHSKIGDDIDVNPEEFKNMPFKFAANKIMTDKKFITVRPQAYKMGTYKAPNGSLYNVIPEGKGSMDEYLEAHKMTKDKFIKDFLGEEEIKYPHVQDFLDNKVDMNVYRIEKVTNRDDIIPEISDPRFNEVYQNRIALIDKIKKHIKNEQDPIRVEELRTRLNTLKEQTASLLSDDTRTFAGLLDIMKNDVASVKKILDTKTDRRSLDFAKALISNYVDLLTDDFGTVVESLDTQTKEGILNFITDTKTLADRINKQFLSIANAEVMRLTSKNQLKVNGIPVDADDTNIAAGWAYDTRWNKNPIVQSITKIIRDAQVSIALQLTQFRAINKKMLHALREAKHSFDFMIQTDSKGKRTGLFVSRESAEYKEARKEASRDSNSQLLFYAQNHDFKINESAWKQREVFLMDYYKNNNNITINSTDELNGITYEKKIEKYANDMTLKKNPYTMKAILERALKGTKRITQSDREFFTEFMEYGGLYAEKMGDKYIHPLEMTAHDKWVDPKWRDIQNLSRTDPRKQFYDHWSAYIDKGRRMRRDEDRHLPWNYIPEKYKTLGVLAKTNQFLHDHLTQRISQNMNSIDPETGEVEKNIPLYMLNDSISPENKSYDLGDVLEDFVKETLNYDEKHKIEEPANMLLSMLRQQPVYETNADGSIKKAGGKEQFKSGLSNNYIQAAHKLAASIYGETQDKEFVAKDMKFYTADAKKDMKSIREDINNLKLTPQEKTIATQYTANRVAYDGNNEKIAKYVELATKYQQLRDTGRNFTGSKFVNSLMFFTSVKYLGLNLFAGFGEVLQGYSTLFTESAGRRYFTDKEAARAMGLSLSAATPWHTDIKEKVEGITKLFDTPGDIFHESEARVKGKLENVAFLQYKVANIATNTSFTIAMLLHDKVKDTHGVEHSLFDAMSFKDGKASWTKDIDIPLYTDNKPSQYLIDLVHKSDEILVLNRERKTFMDPIKVDSKMVGRILGQFKKNWMIGMFYNRFGDAREANLTGGHDFEGFYKTFWKALTDVPKITDPITGEQTSVGGVKALGYGVKNLFKYLYKFSTIGKMTGAIKEGEYTPMVEANLRKFMRELSMAMTLYSTMLVLSSMNGGDDKDQLRTYFINQILRLQRDVTTFMSIESLTSFMKNPAPITSTLSDFVQIQDAIAKSLVLGDPYNSKGQLRVLNVIQSNVPFYNQIGNMKNKFKQAIIYGNK